MTLIEMIEKKLVEMGIVELAKKPVESGTTEETKPEEKPAEEKPDEEKVEEVKPKFQMYFPLDVTEVGKPVNDPKGNPIPDGEYSIMSDGKIFKIVVKDGVLESEPAEVKEEEIGMSEELSEYLKGEGFTTLNVKLSLEDFKKIQTLITNKLNEVKLAEETVLTEKIEKLKEGYESVIEALKVGETKTVTPTKVVEEKPKTYSKMDIIKQNIIEKRKEQQ